MTDACTPLRVPALVALLCGIGSGATTGPLAAQQAPGGPAAHELAVPLVVDGALTDWTGVPSFAIPFRSGTGDSPGPAARARLA